MKILNIKNLNVVAAENDSDECFNFILKQANVSRSIRQDWKCPRYRYMAAKVSLGTEWCLFTGHNKKTALDKPGIKAISSSFKVDRMSSSLDILHGMSLTNEVKITNGFRVGCKQSLPQEITSCRVQRSAYPLEVFVGSMLKLDNTL